ncbi:FAD-binding oxidoreductase [Flavobacteriales bacterium]|nr:FAD-binding oxidoreductase [Flavobacteriales bacterium]
MGLFKKKKKTESSGNAMALTVAEIKEETPDSISIGFQVPDAEKSNYAFVAGQYLTLIADIDGEEVRRSYSICGGEQDALLRIGVKRVKEGRMSNYLPNALKVGDTVDVMFPAGNFKLEDGSKSYVAFAAGSGITPIMSQIKKTAKAGGSYKLFYGNNSEESTMFKQELDALCSDRISVNYSFTSKGDARYTEATVSEILKENLELLKADAFYLCGPQEMIEGAKTAIAAFGVAPEKIHFELFVAVLPDAKKAKKKKAEKSKGAVPATVVLEGESISLSIDPKGDSILDQVLDKGYDAPYSCKGAVCSTCKAKVLEGSARLDANFSLSDKELEEGYILTCQAHPTSDTITVDYDQL